MSRKIFAAVSLLVLASLLMTACQPQTVVQTVVVKETSIVEKQVEKQVVATAAPTAAPPKPAGPKVLRMSSGPGDVPTIDPPFAVDMSSIQIVEDTTVGLVRQNPANAQVEAGHGDQVGCLGRRQSVHFQDSWQRAVGPVGWQKGRQSPDLPG